MQALRLEPGDDVRLALQLDGRTGFVVAGIGSLAHAQLRFAGELAPTRIDGPLEILTLSGSLTRDGAHLHASVSDASGRVLGGHVCAGCEVRTTVELLISPLPAGSLGREFDAATGHAELRVRDS
ncbi:MULTISPECIES: PPC domain-containing DNA-binding protein [unclassified Roseateles]|uniref:PPC domain-containing DNA-binding protein n=1 Tax=unclassified Roseateles TaxID=2626991 RepID=UPI0006F5E5E7|nr:MULTISPECIES: PPC domain-containing DNA-binding protein [unclassified Roseateles]KQW42040.1 DNA-binding protein [Pelomonas sp. Root405]KRA67643.1 DNA-binding protein [Pelomonas sp. Root662]